ncbi:MAG: helix-turn-helix transcriptional regulator [Pseudomonadota bacterium]
MAPRKQPNPIDVHVGSRLKLRRTMMGMTQEKLGDQLGVTFQQIQKYEKGTNRIGASRLQEISEILDAPVAFFFEDASPIEMPRRDAQGISGFAEDAGSFRTPQSNPGEAHALTKAFSQISDARIRRRIIDLVETLADSSR